MLYDIIEQIKQFVQFDIILFMFYYISSLVSKYQQVLRITYNV